MKTVVEVKPMMLLPPRKDLCQECAVDHPADHPHDASSMFYAVKFKMDHGREGTWEDAMAHCSDEMKTHWRSELKRQFRIDTTSIYTRGGGP